MSATEVIEWLECAGARLAVVNGRRSLRTPKGAPVPDDEVKAAIVEHATEIDRHFEEQVSRECPECGKGLHAADEDAVFESCGNLYCPSWRPGLGPEWFAKARSYALWKRGRQATDAARLDEGIPE